MLPPDVTQRLLQAGSAGALADAAAFLHGRLRPDGAPDGQADDRDDDGDLAERQWALLLAWAETSGQILPLGFPAPDREGGREHDVSLHEPSGRWIKYTKPSACGFTVSWSDDGRPYLHNARPLDYLRRLLWQNEALGDDIHLVGLWPETPHRWRIVTTQPGLQGSRASLAELSPEGLPLPFDVLITRSPDKSMKAE